MVIRKQPKSGKVSVTGKGGKEIDTGQEKMRERGGRGDREAR